MKNINGEIEYKDKIYKIVFNLNVMEQIQDEYGSLDKWGELTEGKDGVEPNIKAVKFGFTAMLNEAIDIENDENQGTGIKPTAPLTKAFVGRMLTDIGLREMAKKLHETVTESTKSTEKNV